MADVLQAYSRQAHHKINQLATVRSALIKLKDEQLEPRQAPIRRPSRRYRIADRCTLGEITAMVGRYQAGEYSTDLAKEYGIAKSTPLKLLAEHGAEIRSRGLTPAKERENLRLRQQGMIIRDIAKRVGCSYDTARKFLLTSTSS